MAKGSFSGKKVAVVGATGAVGIEMVKVLYERKFPIVELHLFASARSAGKTVSTPFGEKTIEAFSVEAVREMDIVLMAVSGTFAQENCPKIVEGADGPVVIDNSSAFRYDPEVPLVIPEINGYKVKNARLIANPNCTTAVAAMALWPIHCRFGLKKVIISTYQAASGAGAEGMEELLNETKAVINGQKAGNKIFAHPLPFNVVPHIDSFQQNGYTKEEMKVLWETRKIFDLPSLAVSCTAVRVPTLRAHAEALTIETMLPITPEGARDVLRVATGVQLQDSPEEKVYPMPLSASEKYDVEVGRIRQSTVYNNYGLDLFVCGDQLLRGAALNAVLIAECLETPPLSASLQGERKKFRPPVRESLTHSLSSSPVFLPLVVGTTALVTLGLSSVWRRYGY